MMAINHAARTPPDLIDRPWPKSMLKYPNGIKATSMGLMPAIFMNCCIIFPEDNTMANGKWVRGGESQITNVARRWQVHGWDGRCHEHNK